jgi:hypothetical protein
VSYYGAGDYYGAGGIGSFLKGVVRTGVSLVTGGPVAAARTAVSAIATRSPVGLPTALLAPPQQGARMPGLGGFAQRVIPGGASGYYSRREYTKDGRPRRIRKDGKPWGIPSMDPGNTKALKRASRRIDRFVGIARAAMKHTKYGVYTRSSRAGGKRRK